LVGKFLKTNDSTGELQAVFKMVHVRGERRPRYYRKRSIQIGEWRRAWSELITDKNVIRELRRQRSAMIQSKKTPFPSSPVNRLFGALIKQLASDLPKDPPGRPDGISQSDWDLNLSRARRLLERKSAGPWTASEVYRTLGRGAHLCGACRTFLIRGFRINDRRITRARQFCDDACKMRAERRKKRMPKPTVSLDSANFTS
jgi:hypothetical protein